MEKIVSLAKRRGFVYQGSEIYGGLAGTFDYGPMGVVLKNNIKQIWRRLFVDGWGDMYEVDAAILMNPKVWEASGHVSGISDPQVECKKCGKRFRADQLEEKMLKENPCTKGAHEFGPVRQINMKYQQQIGATEGSNS